jgi:hypothetical protein
MYHRQLVNVTQVKGIITVQLRLSLDLLHYHESFTQGHHLASSFCYLLAYHIKLGCLIRPQLHFCREVVVSRGLMNGAQILVRLTNTPCGNGKRPVAASSRRGWLAMCRWWSRMGNLQLVINMFIERLRLLSAGTRKLSGARAGQHIFPKPGCKCTRLHRATSNLDTQDRENIADHSVTEHFLLRM